MNRSKLLVLDLDETLIHATEERLDRAEDFKIFEYYVYKRPHLDWFLDFAFSMFEVGVWTSSGEQYAQGIVSEVFRTRPPAFLFSGRKCTLRRDFNSGDYVPLKRLSKLKSKGYTLDEMIAVDDSAYKHKDNYGNLVHVDEYKGALNDEELQLLCRYLTLLVREPNIRSVEKRGWRERALEIGRDEA